MPQIVPLTNDPARRFEIELNGVSVYISTRYSYNNKTWYLSMEDLDGLIFRGIAMLGGVDLLESQEALRERIGQLWIVDRSGGRTDPTLVGLGDRYVLVNYAPGESIDPAELLDGNIV